MVFLAVRGEFWKIPTTQAANQIPTDEGKPRVLGMEPVSLSLSGCSLTGKTGESVEIRGFNLQLQVRFLPP